LTGFTTNLAAFQFKNAIFATKLPSCRKKPEVLSQECPKRHSKLQYVRYSSASERSCLVFTYVATNSGGFGFVEADLAQPFLTKAPISDAPAPIQAAVQNPVSGNFYTSSLASIRAALTNISLVADSTYPCVLTVTGLPDVPTVGNAYPIIVPSYALTYTNYPTQAEVNAVKGLFSFILGNRTTSIQTNDQIAQQAGAVLLGKGTTPATNNPLRIQARACINSAKVGIGPN
jgi:hypothetical protein